MPGKLIVFSSPAEGREQEYNDWYDHVHLGEVLALGPFTAATRHRVSDEQVFPVEHRYVAIYDFDRRIITMVGNVALRRGTDTLNGGRLVIDLDSGVSSVDGRSGGSSPAIGGPAGSSSGGGRVSGTFSVPARNEP